MEQISAADNVTIELDTDRWRMISNGAAEPKVLLEAVSGHPMQYRREFAQTRRLPQDGTLATDQIQRIVLGWSNSDEAWHLGLLLEGELAQARGSRWCEIAHWPDPSKTVFGDIAARAGEMLAEVTTRPFSVVQPKAQPTPQPQPQAPARPLPPLPLPLGDLWTLQAAESGGVQMQRAPRWARMTLRRALWYAFWAAVYFVLVYATFNSGIAPANPEFLPYLGTAAGLVLVGLTFRNLLQLVRQPNRIVFSRAGIEALRGSQVRWRLDRSEIQGLYASLVISRRRGKIISPHGELNLLLANKRFRLLLAVDRMELYEPEALSSEDQVMPLTADQCVTSLQAAALHMAQTLGCPAYDDRRAG
jgi:hypothetical protein